MTEKKKRGRKPMGKKPLTDTEKKRRLRARQSAYVKAAKAHGYEPVTVMIAKQHMAAFEELHQKWGGSRSEQLSVIIFGTMKKYFEEMKMVNEEDWPDVCEVQVIKFTAADMFKEWEKQQ